MNLARAFVTLCRAAATAATNAIADQRQRDALGPGVIFGAGAIVRGAERMTIGAGTFVDTRAYLVAGMVGERPGFVRIGRGCEIGPYSVLWGGGGIEIGDNVHLGAHVHITSQQGRPVARGDNSIGRLTVDCAPVRIGNHVLIYSGAIIVPGVTIGHHSVIGAGAVVTRDVPAYSIAMGVPARSASLNGMSEANVADAVCS
jgi:carbonic anhydrase/acetyltransferase-like protein (isoleucine patch superfamily)